MYGDRVEIRPRRRRGGRALAFAGPGLLALILAAACGDDGGTAPADGGPDASADAPWDHPKVPYDGATGQGVPRVPVHAETVSSRVDTRQLLFAAGEMQISGEPFAEGFAGRNLANYDRAYLPTDQYILDNGAQDPKPVTDLFGFSTAVESYEYSKYHMNTLVNESSAGVSLMNGPIVIARAEGTPFDRFKGRMTELLTAGGADVGGIALVPPPPTNDQNVLGFAGLWPSFAPFVDFDPTIDAHDQVVRSCTFSGGYGGIPTIGQETPEYECAYNSLHLTDRDGQVTKKISPGVLGLAAWKEALWSIDFVGRLHDGQDNPVEAVADEDRDKVGTLNNVVRGTNPATAWPGTYIGSTPFEGMWGLTMLAEMDNLAEWLTSSLTTTDGAALGGFATRGDALAYDDGAPLRWFPAAVHVTEDSSGVFPLVTGLAIDDASSHAEDLAGLLIGHAMLFAMSDARNAGIGQRLGLELTFDGDPFPADNGLADGEATVHDRSLAVLKVALVDLDRMHTDKGAHVVTDRATVSSGVATPGSTVTTTSLAHVILGLRQALLAVNGSISQYGAPDPSPTADQGGILGAAFSTRVRKLVVDNGAFVRDVLTKSDGSVANGATLSSGVATPTTTPTTLESQSAAVRALVEAFLVTGDATFFDRARAVAKKLTSDFYSAPARMYRGVLGGADEVSMTPERFAWLQSALRETYKVLHVPGDPLLGRDVLEDRVARVNKLFLNGWDDLDGDEKVATATECLAGRLQLGEQALTGELGQDDNGVHTSDRDQDCVLEIDDAKKGSVMASEVHFHSP